jgi:type I restriction enzyme S subunit
LGLKKSSAKLFPAYSVMMTSRATIGVVSINTQPACTNQGFITCIPNEQLSMYLIYYWLISNKDKIINLASGATFKEINKTTFRKLPIVIPETKIQELFIQLLEPIFKQVENLQQKNNNLQKTRDLLLPKLISGQIDVENLDIDTGDIAA